ncbi:hypothetical protein [Rhizobium leguminosarum]|uniref:hypothetical protein n=1 Tax=Rhizobium leguminosarum TaxID=384 RepID=UPI001C96C8B0|nr:hypothetical protein [Rhizobium leguminosarum]MBY5689342.1 hypothetical protein [Rhizobium leguminosarum]
MTNAVRGIVTAEIDGKTVTLCLSANQWCDLEEEHGKSTRHILGRFEEMAAEEDLDMRFLRSLFRAALSYSQPDVTLEQAGAIMQACGLVEAAKLVGQAAVLSMPEVKGTAGKPKGTKAKTG